MKDSFSTCVVIHIILFKKILGLIIILCSQVDVLQMRTEVITKAECCIINITIGGIVHLILKLNNLRNHIRIE
jgi:hypothetical protein